MGIAMNIERIKQLAEKFGITFGIMFGVVFALHLLGLTILSFITMKFLVVSELNVVEMSWVGRTALVFFYLILPTFVAGWRTLSTEIHELINNKESESAPEQQDTAND